MMRTMRRALERLSLAVLVSSSLIGCSDQFDGTNGQTQKESLHAMAESLEGEERLRFADALEFLAKEGDFVLDIVPKTDGLEGLLEGKNAEDVIRIAEAAKRQWLASEYCGALDKVATKLINYAARQSNRRKDKKLPTAEDVASGVDLAENQERIGYERIPFGVDVSFAIYQEGDRRTLAALHPGCVDSYGAPKVVYWNFLADGETEWF